MATKITQQEIKFYSELVNGSDFQLNRNNFSTVFSEAPATRCQAEIVVDIETGFSLSGFNLLYAGENLASNTNTDYKIYKVDGQFIKEGVTAGTRILLTHNSTAEGGTLFTTNYLLQVTAVTNQEIYFTWISSPIANGTLNDLFIHVNSAANDNNPVQYDQQSYVSVIPDYTRLDFSFNLVENNASPSMVSALTSSTESVRVRNLNPSPGATATTGTASSLNRAWVSGDVTAQYLQPVYSTNPLSQLLGGAKQFVITHEFIVPYYLDGQTIDDPTDPPLMYKGNKSPKYIYEVTFYTDSHDPNTAVKQKHSTTLGNAGHFNEAYNGDSSPFISSVTYLNADNEPVDKLSIGEITTCTVFIVNVLGDALDAAHSLVIGHGAIIESDEYANSSVDFAETWSFETAYTLVGDSPVDGSIIKGFSANLVSAPAMIATFQIDLTDTSRLIEGQEYILTAHVKNDQVDLDTSGKTQLLLDKNEYGISEVQTDGLFGVARFEQVPHPTSLNNGATLGTSNGYTNAKVNIEEGLQSISKIWLDTSKNAELESLSFNIGIWNTATNTIVSTLRTTNLDISNYINGNINLSSDSGYPLSIDDVFNLKTIETSSLVGSKQFYDIKVGYKVPWAEWRAFRDAPEDFFNIDEPQDGLNENSSNYSGVGNYQVRVFIDSKVSQGGAVTGYRTVSEEIEVYEYDEDDNNSGSPTYVAEISTYNSLGVAIENKMLESEYTRIQAKFTPAVAPALTESVNFLEASELYDETTDPNGWKRFGFGNINTVGNYKRLGDWIDNTADDDDTFIGAVPNGGGTTFNTHNKLDAIYGSTLTEVSTTANVGAYYGLNSTEVYSTFGATGTFYSTFADNDAISFVISLFKDFTGKTHTLSLMATTGGIGFENNPAYTVGSTTTDIILFNPTNVNTRVALVYNFGKDDCKELKFFNIPESGRDWDTSGEMDFILSKVGSNISVGIDWTIGGNRYQTAATSELTFNLNSDILTEKFIGSNPIGVGFVSQPAAGVKDLIISLPDEDYFGNIRIETEESLSDNIYELSNIIEGDKSNLLKQIDGNLINSKLSWVTDAFYLDCLVATDKINSGEKYKLSAEIGRTDLGALELLPIFAWVDAATPNRLRVLFNHTISVPPFGDLGLTLSGGVNVSSFENTSSDVATYILSRNISLNEVLNVTLSNSSNVTKTDTDGGSILATGKTLNIYTK